MKPHHPMSRVVRARQHHQPLDWRRLAIASPRRVKRLLKCYLIDRQTVDLLHGDRHTPRVASFPLACGRALALPSRDEVSVTRVRGGLVIRDRGDREALVGADGRFAVDWLGAELIDASGVLLASDRFWGDRERVNCAVSRD